MRILAIDTATECCSAALSTDGGILSREIETDRKHAELILPMVDELLAKAGISLRQVDAIGFGRGPGGFTGVRLAASVTQGLAFGANLPVIGISDLRAVAQRALDLDSSLQRVLVCNDARMQEVYWACFERNAEELAIALGEEHVGPPGSVSRPSTAALTAWGGAGRGFRLYKESLQALTGQLQRVHDDLLPRAVEIAKLAACEFAAGRAVAPEQAIPIYLRDDVARPPASSV